MAEIDVAALFLWLMSGLGYFLVALVVLVLLGFIFPPPDIDEPVEPRDGPPETTPDPRIKGPFRREDDGP